MKNRALILVDLQNDFMPDGALPVPEGYDVIEVANALQSRFDLVVATQDWHPPDHRSFASNHPGKQPGDVVDLEGLEQILWPDHCVQDTRGAEFVRGLELDHVARVFQKGTDPFIDSYSGFSDNGHRKSTGLDEYLRDHGVDTVYVAGVATDYCVKYTALDALRQGFDTWVVRDGCRAVNLAPGDDDRAFAEMRSAGAHIVDRDDV